MKTRERVINLLNENPDLEHDPHELARLADCHVTSARKHIKNWNYTKHITWARDRVVATKKCSRCEHEAECRSLDALGLPLLCERVPASDLELIELHDLMDVFEMSREQPEEVPVVVAEQMAMFADMEGEPA